MSQLLTKEPVEAGAPEPFGDFDSQVSVCVCVCVCVCGV